MVSTYIHSQFYPSSSKKMLFLVFLSTLALQFLVNAETDQDHSPSWVTFCDGSYLFSEDAKNWQDASDNCLLYGSHLLQIDNMAENYCLLEYAQSQGMKVDYWSHSGNDIEWEGVYRQADGEPILWSPLWHSGDPDGGTGSNCLLVRLLGDSLAGRWWDDPCTNARHYICERS